MKMPGNPVLSHLLWMQEGPLQEENFVLEKNLYQDLLVQDSKTKMSLVLPQC